MAPCRWLAIVNPVSGAMRSRAFRERWMPRIEQAASVAVSDDPAHATRLAAGAGRYDGVAAVGGDGTVLSVLAGVDRDRQRVAILPAGRGNSLARDLGVASMERALDALDTGRPRRIDLMDVELEHAGGTTTRALAGSTVAVGYAAEVARMAGTFAIAGQHAYALATVFVRPAARSMQIAYGDDGFASVVRTGLLVSNTRFVANFLAFPESDHSDGMIDVMELTRDWLHQMLHNVSVLSGSGSVQPHRRVRARAVRVRLPTPAPVMVDGEMYAGVASVRLACLPGGALCQVPAAA